MKKITPLVDKINDHYIGLEKISNDALRDKQIYLRKKFSIIRRDRNKIDDLNNKIVDEKSSVEKEKMFSEVEALDSELKEVKRNTLVEILPEAFAVVKETARRFVNNSEIIVNASDIDKKLSSNKSYVKVKKLKAIWINSWDAAGKNVLWDMIHYDVQLIGGIVLHQGKIAEMQTGEGKTVVSASCLFKCLTGDGVHLVTVNGYLARRDSVDGSILNFTDLV